MDKLTTLQRFFLMMCVLLGLTFLPTFLLKLYYQPVQATPVHIFEHIADAGGCDIYRAYTRAGWVYVATAPSQRVCAITVGP